MATETNGHGPAARSSKWSAGQNTCSSYPGIKKCTDLRPEFLDNIFCFQMAASGEHFEPGSGATGKVID